MKANTSTRQLGFDFDRPRIKPIRLWSADELFDGMSEAVAVDAQEDHRVERKSASYKARELGDYFSMWANTAPDGGIILLGVENDGIISGCNRVDVGHVNDLQRAGHVYACDARSQCKAVTVTNAKGEPDSIMAIRVFYRDDRVVETAAGDAFIRVGSTKKRLTDPEKRELQHMKGQLEIESEPVALRYPDDFNETKVNAFANAVAAERQLPERSVEEILQLRRLGKIKPTGFVPNLACALLFAEDPVAIVPVRSVRKTLRPAALNRTARIAISPFAESGPCRAAAGNFPSKRLLLSGVRDAQHQEAADPDSGSPDRSVQRRIHLHGARRSC
jgi:ATP-dependent DNA helicase RecG